MTMAQSATGAKLVIGITVKSRSQPPTTATSMAQPSLLVNMPAEVRCTIDQELVAPP